MHASSYQNMQDFRDKHLEDRKEDPLLVIDLGSCDINGSYRPIFARNPWVYHGMDASPGKNVDIVLKNPYDWKEIKSSSVDVLISGQAFEHIEYFWITMLEIKRVLKPGGICCIIAPSGGKEHRFPVDCWRFYPDGLAALARFARLDMIEHFTCWKPDLRFKDGSNDWKDSVLICGKPAETPLKEKLRLYLLHKII